MAKKIKFLKKTHNYLLKNPLKIISTIWIFFFSSLLFSVFYIFSVSINLGNLFGKLPSSTILENPDSELSSELYSADGILLGKYYRLNRSHVEYNQISDHIKNALYSAEDWNFYSHSGIDLKGLLRAAILSIILRRHKGGGSTITQQLAKNLFKTRGENCKGILSNIPIIKTLIVKTKEWIVAVRLERAYTKKEIVSMYLNTVSFGSNAFGIKSATKTFFSCDPDQVTLDQAALLIGLLKAPTKFSPILNPKACLKRRNIILNQMLKKKYLSKDQLNTYKSTPIKLLYKIDNHKSGIATYFRAQVCKYLLAWTKKNGYDLYSDGLKVYTTLDSRIQKHAEIAMKEHMSKLQEKFDIHWKYENPWRDEDGNEIVDFVKKASKNIILYKQLLTQYEDDTETIAKIMNTPRITKVFTWEGPVWVNLSPLEEISYNKKLLRASLLALDPNSGHIKAWVGGIDYNFFQYDNVLQGSRQPGSLFKTLVYTVALENGFSPHDQVYDVPVTFSTPGSVNKTWTPNNWYKSFTGEKLTLRQALARSINSVTAHLMKEIGPNMVVKYAKRLGITSKLDPVPSICLGTSDITLFEIVGAFNTFINKGIWIKPFFITRIEDKYGNLIQEFHPVKREAISEETAYKMLYMLRGSQEEVGGSARRLNKVITENNQVATKSGTTQNQSDGWYLGITKSLTAGVWVGAEDRCVHFRTFREGQSGVTAKPLWENFMIRIYQDEELGMEKGKFPPPNQKIKSLQKYKNKEIDDKDNIDEKVKSKKILNIDEIY